jgi:Cache 3/Cache 2 fusion domain
MRWHHLGSQVRTRVVFGLMITGATVALVSVASGARPAARDDHELAATIFSYDGKDFIRTKTTLKTSDGKSAVNTKLDHGTAAFKALARKRSYSGEVTVFGKKYNADYAPMTSADGKLTGALFVAEEE